MHPLLAPAHVVALIGIALVAARGPGRARAAIVVVFAAVLACGLVAIALGAGETPAIDVLWAMPGGCGIAAAAGMRLRSGLSATVAATIAFAAGATLGLDSPLETIFLGEVAVMLIGTACYRPQHVLCRRFAGAERNGDEPIGQACRKGGDDRGARTARATRSDECNADERDHMRRRQQRMQEASGKTQSAPEGKGATWGFALLSWGSGASYVCTGKTGRTREESHLRL